jgi:hypothetical protein
VAGRARLCGGLGDVAGVAQGLQVAVLIGAATGLVEDVVNLSCRLDQASALAGLAQATVTAHDGVARFGPFVAVATGVAAAAPAVGKRSVDHLVRIAA